MERRIWAALLPICVFSLTGFAQGQEARLTSYDDLLVRMDHLEQQLQASQTTPTHTAASCNTCGTCGPCPCSTGHYYGSYEAVFVTPFQSNNTAIIAQNDPVIEHLGFDWEMKYSNRFELGYLAPTCGIGWRARYWQFDQSTSFAVDNSVGLVQDEGAIIWAATSDNVIGLVDVDTAVMTHSIDMQVWDMELQAQATKNLLLSGGFRYAEIDQNYLAVTDSGIGTGLMDFQGYGPTMSAEFHRNVCGGWDLFANGRGSLLYGKQAFVGTDNVSNTQMAINNGGTLSSALETQMGLKWTSRNNRFFFKTALEAQYWANVGSPNPAATFTDASDEANTDDPLNESLGFVGFTVGGGVQY